MVGEPKKMLPEEAINLIKKVLPYIKAFTLALFGIDLQIALEKVSEK